MARLTDGFAYQKLTLTLGLTSRMLLHAKFWHAHHGLTWVISPSQPRVQL